MLRHKEQVVGSSAREEMLLNNVNELQAAIARNEQMWAAKVSDAKR